MQSAYCENIGVTNGDFADYRAEDIVKKNLRPETETVLPAAKAEGNGSMQAPAGSSDAPAQDAERGQHVAEKKEDIKVPESADQLCDYEDLALIPEEFTSERRASLHVVRRMEINEDYDDDGGDEL